ncbi:MAG: hypothetical protein IT249_18130 [Chitinophagaceae bacterium]|nr:hypothetical protein [Chitinophagaceae bacterium]
MAEKTTQSKKAFTLHYKNEKLKVSSGDQIIFSIEFPDGKQKDITFELDTDMDLQWKCISGESTAITKEIGSLIEKEMMA